MKEEEDDEEEEEEKKKKGRKKKEAGILPKSESRFWELLLSISPSSSDTRYSGPMVTPLTPFVALS